MNIVLFGLYGSGKSTLAAVLAQKFGLKIISSAVFREYLVANNIYYPLDNGQKYPPELFARFITATAKGKSGFVFDNIYTTWGLDAVRDAVKVDRYILLDIDETTARARVMQRARPDATEEFFARRSAAFDENIGEFKKQLGKKIEVYDATLPIEVLHKQILDGTGRGGRR